MDPKTIIRIREKAAELRRLATVRTNGGAFTDRLLLAIADQLDHDADQKEQANEPDGN